MAHDHFKVALEAALKFFPNIKLKEEQELCIRSIVLDKMDVLAVLPTGYGKTHRLRHTQRTTSQINLIYSAYIPFNNS
jgi:superfamily II DNA or RNA helicase